MSTERDVNRIVRSWLDEGVTVLPDRVLDAVLDQLPATSQRRAGWLARRFPPMSNNIVRYGIAAAAVVLVFIVGVMLVPGLNLGGHVQTPTPSLTPDEQNPIDQGIPLSTSQRLVPGTHKLYGQWRAAPETMVATLPSGWVAQTIGRGGGLWYPDPGNPIALLHFGSVGNLFADPCSGGGGAPGLDPPIGPTVDDLVVALSSLPVLDISAPVGITVDGYKGKQIELTHPGGVVGCSDFALWRVPMGGGENSEVHINQRWHSTVQILDVGGQRFVIIASYWLDAGDQVKRELKQIVDSIKIPR